MPESMLNHAQTLNKPTTPKSQNQIDRPTLLQIENKGKYNKRVFACVSCFNGRETTPPKWHIPTSYYFAGLESCLLYARNKIQLIASSEASCVPYLNTMHLIRTDGTLQNNPCPELEYHACIPLAQPSCHADRSASTYGLSKTNPPPTAKMVSSVVHVDMTQSKS